MDKEFNIDEFRRRDDRKKYEAEVYFSVAQKAYTATIKNISRGGALVYTGGMPRIKAGEKIIITIPFTDSTKNLKRKARVMWANSELMGVQFI
ncbi:MAG: PilZ domain-containing protein [Deltaproteobacteria bacterium]|nr:PilZ domain-containing protein [Deltaproteobacteria bacterium]MBW2178552.1 PilZ domain-containing protein [Deltaproteobacteria bacterium]